MRQYIAELSRIADCHISCYPNAGLPNAFGEYDESPSDMATVIKEFATSSLVNILGGCCGTTPEHIAAIAAAAEGLQVRTPSSVPSAMRLSGLEPPTIDEDQCFVNRSEDEREGEKG